jgi:hypothetical protein
MRPAGLLLSAALLVAFPTGTVAAEPLPSPPSLRSSPGWRLAASYGITGPSRVGGDVSLRTGEPFAIVAACRGASEVIVLLGPLPTEDVWGGRAFEFPCLPGDGPFLTTRFVADSATASDVYVQVAPDGARPDRVVTVLVEQAEHPASLAPSPSASVVG